MENLIYGRDVKLFFTSLQRHFCITYEAKEYPSLSQRPTAHMLIDGGCPQVNTSEEVQGDLIWVGKGSP